MIDSEVFGRLFQYRDPSQLIILKVLGHGVNKECYHIRSWNFNTGKKKQHKTFHYTALQNWKRK